MSTSTLNFNVGMLGHIDSGKTTLARALSRVASTACFDKNRQSQERGITIDLGFSSFTAEAPQHLHQHGFSTVQFTLVDCPGHASLIKTIIGGAQIIDLMVLVVDVVKGVQTQTAECLVIGQILCDRLLVALNKTDLLADGARHKHVQKMSRRLRATLQNTHFKDAPVVALSARPGGTEDATCESTGLSDLISCLLSSVYVPQRCVDAPLVLSVDHCFSIRGQGTVMTGTVLQGSIAVNQVVEIPALKVSRKVKSLQVYRRAVERAVAGDRLGVCVTQFDPSTLERGLLCTPGCLPTIHAAVVTVHKISYYRDAVSSKCRYHVTLGHETVLAGLTLFDRAVSDVGLEDSSTAELDLGVEREYRAQLSDDAACLALLRLERPVTVAPRSLMIGSRLDGDVHTGSCRLAFHGRLLQPFGRDYADRLLPQLRVYKWKRRDGTVERAASHNEVIVKDMFKKETDLRLFSGLKVTLSTGEHGVIQSSFGQSGKVKITVSGGLFEDTRSRLTTTVKTRRAPTNSQNGDSTASVTADSTASVPTDRVRVQLTFKRFMFDPLKRIVQS